MKVSQKQEKPPRLRGFFHICPQDESLLSEIRQLLRRSLI